MIQSHQPPPSLKRIFIPDLLQAPDQTQTLDVNQYLPDLETLLPVQGQIELKHQRNYLAVRATATAITTLTCDRCLCRYNYRLQIDLEELIWLKEAPKEAKELDLTVESLEGEAQDELVESLAPNDYFDPTQWLYEQLCLAVPFQKICDPDCPGISVQPSDEATDCIDQRWSALEILKRQLSN
jgi:uncharacterized protein